jgi:general secretion pathway protein K
MALAVVLWVLAFLGIVFTAFLFSMRTELAAARNFREQTEAYFLAEAGVYRAAAEIVNADRNVPPNSTQYDAVQESWHTNPQAFDGASAGRGTYWVRVIDEESKIPLNGASDAVLRRLFSICGVRDERLVSVIVDSIQDWRDADSLHRLNGAEDSYYLSLPIPYKAKNGDFDTIDELLLVKGMTPEILYGTVTNPDRRAALEAALPWERDVGSGEYLGVARYLTVHSTGRVNINTAAPEVLMALGLSATETKFALDRRAELPYRSVGELTGLLTSIGGGGRQGFEVVEAGAPGPVGTAQVIAALNQIGAVSSWNFAVDSVATVEGSRLAVRIAAVLMNVGSSGRPKLTIRQWQVDPRQSV